MARSTSNGNDLERRLEQLESRFALFVNLLDRKATRLLYRSHTQDFNNLLHQYETESISPSGSQALCEMLRRIEGDREQPQEIRLLCSLLLIAVELKENARQARQ